MGLICEYMHMVIGLFFSVICDFFNWVFWSEDGAVNMSSCLLHFSKHP